MSYRYGVATYISRAIFTDLRAHSCDVFMDTDGRRSETHNRNILQQIRTRPYFLFLLTAGTLVRCAEPSDWLHREIEYAIETQRTIIPVLVNGFKFNKRTTNLLTPSLSLLTTCRPVTISSTSMDEGMTRLYARLPMPDDRTSSEFVQSVTDAELRAEAHYLHALQKLELGDMGQAFEGFTTAIQLHPLYAEAYNARGAMRDPKKARDAAIEDFSEAIRLSPQYADAYINRGKAWASMGDFGRAFADYDDAIRLDPSSIDGYIQRGIAFSTTGDLDSAIRDYNEAIRLNWQHPRAYSFRGEAYYAKGALVNAYADYRNYLHFGGGLSYGDQSVFEDWVRHLEKKLKL